MLPSKTVVELAQSWNNALKKISYCEEKANNAGSFIFENQYCLFRRCKEYTLSNLIGNVQKDAWRWKLDWIKNAWVDT